MKNKSRMRAINVQKQILFFIFWSMEGATDVGTVNHPWALSNPSLEGCIRRMILGTRFRGGLVGTILNTPLTKVVWRIEDAHGGDTPPDHPCCTATAFTDGHCAWVLHSSPRCSLQSRDPSGFGESRYISIMEYAECSLVFQCMPRELYSQRFLSRWDLVE